MTIILGPGVCAGCRAPVVYALPPARFITALPVARWRNPWDGRVHRCVERVELGEAKAL